MGVPAFFRWLSKKYPSIVVHCVEEKAKEDGEGNKLPIDTSQPNPNDYEFDNLYLDMNGIIHPCSHPENKPAPKNEAEMMVNIFEYIDRIFSIVRPRKLLYMAIDGVAPRAKMNQQRSRRFRAAKESRESKELIFNIKEKLREQGARLPPEPEKKEHFDSNCITPGTDFMDRLAVCLRFYIAERLATDPGWKNIKVILSDANTPGEGEHKIMDYIRRQRAQPDHDPDTKHCLNGADADLIMLGLATHEVHFTILREEFKPNQKKPCEICAQVGHEKQDCEGLPKEQEEEHDVQPFVGQDVEFIFIRLNVLREYLERELRMDGLSFYEFERALDDWVFMCFFVGNDFLPHLPSLEIREGAIDRLVNIYKKCLPRMGGYLAKSGHVNMERVQKILQELGEVEDEIFRKRQEFEQNMKRRRQQNEERNKRQRLEGSDSPSWSPRSYGTPLGRGQSPRTDTPNYKSYYENQRNQNTPENRKAAADLRMLLTPTPDGNPDSPMNTPQSSNRGLKRRHEDSPSTPATPKKEDDEPEDNIRLWEEGWKERYYLHKFAVSKELDPNYFLKFRKKVADEYVLGLCWVLRYYYQGCPSWKWFYPYHYAPFASDFLDIAQVDINFEKGTGPFKPLEQLMSVFPAASGKFLPPTWRELMSGPESPIIDFYPKDFKIDLNGKRYAWQGVALLPFVDEKRLHRTLANVYADLTDDEIRRNRRDSEVLFVRKGHPLYDFLLGLYEEKMLKEKQDLVTDFSQGMRGKVFEDVKLVSAGNVYPCPVPGLPDLSSTQSISVRYEDPQYDDDFIFPATVLSNATMPDRILKPGDFPANKNWKPYIGMTRNDHSPHVSPGGQRMLRHELGINNRSPNFNNHSPYQRMPPPNYRTPSPYHTPPRGRYNNSPSRGGFNNQSWGGQIRPPYYSNPDHGRGRGGYNQGRGSHQRSQSNRDYSFNQNRDDGRRRSFPGSSSNRWS